MHEALGSIPSTEKQMKGGDGKGGMEEAGGDREITKFIWMIHIDNCKSLKQNNEEDWASGSKTENLPSVHKVPLSSSHINKKDNEEKNPQSEVDINQ